MGIAISGFNELFAPLQGLLRWLVVPSRQPRRQRAAAVVPAVAAAPRKPLRVLRVVDACAAPASAGRMVISGRMADVCAELDRLAALEAQALAAPAR
ncbi:MAG: hypothetical protein HYX47_14955 [Burkholderiales bacterium]|nr:hypothetical protein [Burkholderiales bacterium]